MSDQFGRVTPQVTGEHPSKDSTLRFPLDALLRSHQFKIHSRPKKGPNLWIDPEGDILPEPQALSLLPPDEIKEAKRLQREYWRSDGPY